MRQSRSWQFTAPFRHIAAKFPHFAWIGWTMIKFLVWSLQGDLLVRIRGWQRARRRAQEEISESRQHRDVSNVECDIKEYNSVFANDAGRPQQPSILVIDVSLPDPERSAGDRSSFQILQALARLGYKVFSWYDNREADEPTRIRLEAAGVTVMDPSRASDLGKWLKQYGKSLITF